MSADDNRGKLAEAWVKSVGRVQRDCFEMSQVAEEIAIAPTPPLAE